MLETIKIITLELIVLNGCFCGSCCKIIPLISKCSRSNLKLSILYGPCGTVFTTWNWVFNCFQHICTYFRSVLNFSIFEFWVKTYFDLLSIPNLNWYCLRFSYHTFIYSCQYWFARQSININYFNYNLNGNIETNICLLSTKICITLMFSWIKKTKKILEKSDLCSVNT